MMFRGSYTMVVTPFDSAGDLDEAALRRFVDWQIAEGADGLIPLGSTGEFLSQTRAERERVAAIVVEQSAGRVPVIVGAAAEWTKEAVAKRAQLREVLGNLGVLARRAA
jgi:4-hydroxy-tetrahydrodipicolinate synthase